MKLIISLPTVLALCTLWNPSNAAEETTESLSCDTMKCDAGQTCIMEQVYCKKEPCPRRPTCVSSSNVAPGVCTRLCMVGYRCVVLATGPTCVPNNPPPLSCETKVCGVDEVCVLRQAERNKTDCNPIPTCMKGTKVPICNLFCPYQNRCEISETCSRGKCSYKPVCIPITPVTPTEVTS